MTSKPVIDAVNAVGNNQRNEAIIDLYCENIASNFSDEEKTRLLEVISRTKNFQDIKDIAGADQQIEDNLEGQQEFFDIIVDVLSAKLKSTKKKK